MFYFKPLSLLLLSICISCNPAGDNEDANANVNGNGNGAEIERPSKEDNKLQPLQIEDVQVLTARKVRDPHSNYFKEFQAKCKEWKPSKAVVTEIFNNCRIIDGHEYHYYYEILPCYVIGRVLINCDITAKYELNAGGSAVLLLPDTAYFLGYFGNQHFITYRAEY